MVRRQITNEQEYTAILEAIELLLESEPGTTDAAELEALSILVEQYEDIHYPIDVP